MRLVNWRGNASAFILHWSISGYQKGFVRESEKESANWKTVPGTSEWWWCWASSGWSRDGAGLEVVGLRERAALRGTPRPVCGDQCWVSGGSRWDLRWARGGSADSDARSFLWGEKGSKNKPVSQMLVL